MVVVASVSGEIDLSEEFLLVMLEFSDHLDVLLVKVLWIAIQKIVLLEAAIFLIGDKLSKNRLCKRVFGHACRRHRNDEH